MKGPIRWASVTPEINPWGFDYIHRTMGLKTHYLFGTRNYLGHKAAQRSDGVGSWRLSLKGYLNTILERYVYWHSSR